MFALMWLVLGCGHGGETVIVRNADAPAARGPARPLRKAMLAAHNAQRAKHCAPPLAWSEDLAHVAQGWASRLARRGCPLEHSDTRYGENLAAGTRGGFRPEDYVDLWYREVDKYRFRRGGFSMATGHFTQLVWRSTRRVGCALSACENGLEVLVCNYDPPGNVETLFADNVLPTSCKR
jgi:uncharacterized protein YkwD